MIKALLLAALVYFVILPMFQRGPRGILGGGRMNYADFGRTAGPNERLLALCTVLGMRMGAVDGSFSPREVEGILRSLQGVAYGPQAGKLVEQVVRDVMKGAFGSYDERAIFGLFGLSAADSTVRQAVLRVLRDVAHADQGAAVIEERYFYHVASVMGMAEGEARSVWSSSSTGDSYHRNSSSGQRASSPSASHEHYEVLGLKPGATQDEIKKRYRELVKQLHPDKVAHVGGEIEKIVTERFQRVQAAYEALTRTA